MGYAFYTLPDGREAGYGVEAECDAEGCTERIDRGLGYLCGDLGTGAVLNDEKPGCGNYHCGQHQSDHNCPRPGCGVWSFDGDLHCSEVAGHDLPHRDGYCGKKFERTEQDDIDDACEVPLSVMDHLRTPSFWWCQALLVLVAFVVAGIAVWHSDSDGIALWLAVGCIYTAIYLPISWLSTWVGEILRRRRLGL